MRSPGESYASIKTKLIRWSNDRVEVTQQDVKARFSNASMKSDEAPSLFAVRLEKLYRAAYPRKNLEYNATLRTKYFDSVSSDFRNQLVSARAMSLTLTNSEIGWLTIKSLACRSETDKKKTSSANKQQSSDVWVIQPKPNSTPEGRHGCCNCETAVGGPAVTDTRSRLPGSLRDRARSRDASTDHRRESRSGERVDRPRGGSRSPFIRCSYCDISGHDERSCWRKSGRCLACGSDRHRIADCSQRRDQMDSTNNFMQRSRPGASNSANHYPIGDRASYGINCQAQKFTPDGESNSETGVIPHVKRSSTNSSPHKNCRNQGIS